MFKSKYKNKFMKIIISTSLGMVFSGCLTSSGTYTMDAYSSKGMKLNRVDFIVDGSAFRMSKNATCSVYPGSTLKIVNVQTKKELEGESGHKCSGKEPFSLPPYQVNKQIKFNDSVYNINFQNANDEKSIHEYTKGNETVNNWSTLLTIYYIQDENLNLDIWTNQLKRLKNKLYFTNIQDNIGYTGIIHPPSKKHQYIETTVKKTFDIKECRGFVSYSYSKKYPIGTKNDVIKKENEKVYEILKQDKWIPKCNIPNLKSFLNKKYIDNKSPIRIIEDKSFKDAKRVKYTQIWAGKKGKSIVNKQYETKIFNTLEKNCDLKKSDFIETRIVKHVKNFWEEVWLFNDSKSLRDDKVSGVTILLSYNQKNNITNTQFFGQCHAQKDKVFFSAKK